MDYEYPIAKIVEAFSYDESTGVIYWKHPAPGRKTSRVAGTSNGAGYIQISYDGKRFKAHRIAWVLANGVWPSGTIDHINGIRHDNRIANLRDVPMAINAQNRRTIPDRLMGTTYHRRDKRWIAQICLDGVQMHIGSFGTQDEAHAAYVAKKREIHRGSTL